MANNNKESTRYYSNLQENYIAKLLGGTRSANSGAGKWTKSDIEVKSASMSIECKTVMQEKSSVSIKKEWIDKHEKECIEARLENPVLAISFTPDGKDNYYVINQKLMSYLVEKLNEEYL